MIDLHSHPLPGIDDGPVDLEGSLALVRAAQATGTQTLVATPHVDHRWGVDPLGVPGAVAHLNGELERRGIDVAVLSGAEISIARLSTLSPSELDAVRLGGGPYLLVEAPHGATPGSVDAIVREALGRGESIVVAHPERSPFFQRDPARLRALVDAGALTSITAGSMSGRFGTAAREEAIRLLGEALVHNVVSDAHDDRGRPPGLEQAFVDLEPELPGLTAHATWLTCEVPRAILAGEALPAPPAPAPRRRRRKRSWLGRRSHA